MSLNPHDSKSYFHDFSSFTMIHLMKSLQKCILTLTLHPYIFFYKATKVIFYTPFDTMSSTYLSLANCLLAC